MFRRSSHKKERKQMRPRSAALVALAAAAAAQVWRLQGHDWPATDALAAVANRAVAALSPGACSLLPHDTHPTILAGAHVIYESHDGALVEGPAALSLGDDGTIAAVIPLSPSAARADLAAAVALATGRKGAAVRLAPRGAVISPAAVDAHVHANDPGRAGWEGLASATRAAAAGGVGTVVDMPLNSHPSATSAAVLAAKVAAAARWRPLTVDVAFWGGLVPDNARNPDELRAMVSAGARGFKAFMAPSGIPDFGNVSAAEIAAALPTLMAAGVPLLVHAEDVDAVPGLASAGQPPPGDLAAWEASRPPAFEAAAVRAVCDAVVAAVTGSTVPPAPGFRVHIAHVGAPDEVLPLLAAAQAAGAPISGEAVPHALGGLPYPSRAPPPGDPAATLWKCAPPLRGPAAAAGLWAGLLAGTLSTIGSDHSPAHPDRKLRAAGGFGGAWGGIAGLQFSLPSAWTGAALHAPPGAVTPARLAGWMARGPADLAGLGHTKGRIAPGASADVVVWDPGAPADTSVTACHQRHPGVSPYVGMALTGRVLETYVRGRLVFAADERGGRFARAACGRVLTGGGSGGGVRKRGLAGSAAAARAAAAEAAC
jgi:allantoinase